MECKDVSLFSSVPTDVTEANEYHCGFLVFG